MTALVNFGTQPSSFSEMVLRPDSVEKQDVAIAEMDTDETNRQRADLVEDPYLLPPGTILGTPPELQRNLLKKLVLTALNAADRGTAYRSFRSEWPTGHMGKTMTNTQLNALMDKFLGRHPFLEDLVFADQGIRLMNVDSQIAERVHRTKRTKGCLSRDGMLHIPHVTFLRNVLPGSGCSSSANVQRNAGANCAASLISRPSSKASISSTASSHQTKTKPPHDDRLDTRFDSSSYPARRGDKRSRGKAVAEGR
jgi:hypothetical protein